MQTSVTIRIDDTTAFRLHEESVDGAEWTGLYIEEDRGSVLVWFGFPRESAEVHVERIDRLIATLTELKAAKQRRGMTYLDRLEQADPITAAKAYPGYATAYHNRQTLAEFEVGPHLVLSQGEEESA